MANVATGDSITINPTANETIVINSRLETIKSSGNEDRMNLFSTGRFPRIAALPQNILVGTPNQIQVTASGGAALSNVAISFQDRSL